MQTAGTSSSVIMAQEQSNDEAMYHEPWPDAVGWFKKQCGGDNCSVQKYLPVMRWLPKYKRTFIPTDLIAGFTVFLTVIPQSLAYGALAGLQPQYGLYSSFMGCFIYILFGSTRQLTVYPTAILSLLVRPYAIQSFDLVFLITFLVGCTTFLAGILRIGFLVDFISLPVIHGFTAAAAMTIGSAQVKSFFGIRSGSTSDFLVSIESFFTYITETRWADTLLGLFSLITLLVVKQLPRWVNAPHDTRKYTVFKYISFSRNAFVVIVGTLAAYLCETYGNEQPFILTGTVDKGLPSFYPPPFSTTIIDPSTNQTQILDFGEMVSKVGTSVLSISLIATLEMVAVAKAFAKGKPLEASQELMTLGIINVCASFFQAMPATGSFTRTAVNQASGVKTPLGGLITGSLVLLALAFLTGTFYYIPKTSLAAVILAAMIATVDVQGIIEVWRVKRVDFLPFIVTWICCLFVGLDYGILIGVSFNIIYVLYESARPKIEFEEIEVYGQQILIIKPKQSLMFHASEYVNEIILKACTETGDKCRLLIIDGQRIQNIDVTTARNIHLLVDDLKSLGIEVLFFKWNHNTKALIHRLDKEFGKRFITLSIPSNDTGEQLTDQTNLLDTNLIDAIKQKLSERSDNDKMNESSTTISTK